MQDNKIQIFQNSEFGEVRVITKDNEPWFVGKDVANVLGYQKPLNAIRSHVDIEDTLKEGLLDARRITQKTIIINESGLYSLIFNSKLPSAKQFKKWVTSEVLPQIRKTGGYIPITEDDDEKTIMAKALLISQKTIEQKDEIIQKQNEVIKLNEPKVVFTDRILKSHDNITMEEMAKLISDKYYRLGRNKLFEKLRTWGVLTVQSSLPYQSFIDKGYFVVEECTKELKRGMKLYTIIKITPQGQLYIINKIDKEYEEIIKSKDEHDKATKRGYSVRSKKIIGINITNGDVKTYNSLNDAHRDGFKKSNLCLCCKGKIETYKGYKWSYVDSIYA